MQLSNHVLGSSPDLPRQMRSPQFLGFVGAKPCNIDGGFMEVYIYNPSPRSHIGSQGVSRAATEHQIYKRVYSVSKTSMTNDMQQLLW